MSAGLDQRWVVEEKPFHGEGKGELWTAGGAGAGESHFPVELVMKAAMANEKYRLGIHMIATYCLENFDKELVNLASLVGLEFRLDGNTSQFYLE